MKRFLLAMQFLTIVPVRITGRTTEREIAGSAVFFPSVGALQGLLAVTTALVFTRLLNVGVACGMTVAILIISNGGFHMDALADTFDAFAVKSGGNRAKDRERRLSVMKDSTTGAIGVTAVALTVLLKYLLIDSLMRNPAGPARYGVLFLGPVFSKWTMVQTMHSGMSARNDGLGKLFIDSIRDRDILLSLFVTVLLCVPVAGFLRDLQPAAVGIFFLLTFTVQHLFTFFWVKLCTARFGGLTGDTLGAGGELCEILYFMVASSWLQHSI